MIAVYAVDEIWSGSVSAGADIAANASRLSEIRHSRFDVFDDVV